MKKNVIGFLSIGAVIVFAALMIYALNKDPSALPSQLVNRPMPAIDAPLAQGGAFRSAELAAKGQWVVLNFWSTTCVVCRVEAPELERFYQNVASKPDSKVRFVSVNTQESAEQILRYQQDFRLSFPVVMDGDGRISLDFGVYGTPETFFVDPLGTVRHRVAGEVDEDTILRFVSWLDAHPGVDAEAAMRGFAETRSGAGG